MPSPRSYPTLKLGAPLVTRQKIFDLIAPRFGLSGAGVAEKYPVPGNTNIFVLEKDQLRIDADLDLGRLWFANREYLWKARQVPDPASLPDEAGAFDIAKKTLRDLELMPIVIETPPGTSPGKVRPSLQWIDSTRVASWRVAGRERLPETEEILDLHVCFALFVELLFPDRLLRAPVLGFGGKAGVSVGENGDVVGLNCAWRQPSEFEPFAPERDAPPAVAPPDLAYRIRDRGPSDLALYPVWAYENPDGVDNSIRKSLEAPAIVGLFPDPWLPAPAPVQPALGVSAEKTPRGVAGIAWFDDPLLSNTVKNATAFKDAMTRAGWQVPLILPGASGVHGPAGGHGDWTTKPPRVEDVQVMFYVGHADEAGWKVPDGKVRFDSGIAWGVRNLEWIAASACGPLQDQAIRGGTLDVFNWNRVFSGLRSILGYGTTIGDSPEDGAFFATHAQLGLTVHEAWFRMARDVQCRYGPEGDLHVRATVFPVVLYPEYAPGADTPDPTRDHLPGFGDVTRKPAGDPDYFVAVFVPA